MLTLPEIKNPEEMLATNLNGTVNLLNACESTDYDRFVHTGTCEEYGTNPVPFTENQTPTPVSPYSESKIRATKYCVAYQKETGKPVVVLRPFLTYGSFQKSRLLIPHVITSVLLKKPLLTTKGEQTRDFIHVSDVINGYMLASTSSKAVGEIINLGSGKEYQIKSVIQKILRLMNSDLEADYSLPYRSNEKMHFYASNVKAKKVLGWQPKVSLDTGLRQTINWYTQMYERGELSKWLV